MKKKVKILCLAASLFFLFAGVASASLLCEATFKTVDGTPWATLEVGLAGVSGDWTYTYTLSVLTGEGTAGLTVHEFDIPVIPADEDPPGYSDLTVDGLDIASHPVNFAYEMPDENGIVYLIIGGYNLEEGDSTVVSLKSPYDPSCADYYIWNGAMAPPQKAAAAVGDLGGGNSSVPEPTTLILLGIGILGLGAYRSMRGRA